MTDLGSAQTLNGATASMCTHGFASLRVLRMRNSSNGRNGPYLPGDDVVSLVYNLLVICYQGLANQFKDASIKADGPADFWKKRLYSAGCGWGSVLGTCAAAMLKLGTCCVARLAFWMILMNLASFQRVTNMSELMVALLV